jgi:D-alanyl-D-alanine carboxypeptidase
MMKSAGVALFSLCIAAATARLALGAAPPETALQAQIDAYLAPLKAHHALSGAVLIARGGNVVVEEYAGYRDFAKIAPNDDGTSFAIASITKTFTAAAIERLVLDKKVSLSDPVSRYISTFPNGANIKVEMLLLHTAGLANPDYGDLLHRKAGLDDVVASIAAQPPLFAPGSSERYSNAGFIILAKIIEVASGRPYADYLHTTFIEPLGLSHTFPDDGLRLRAGTAVPYVPAPPPGYVEPVPPQQVTAFTGSGILMSSARDLQTWAESVANDKIVPLTSFSYPFGWGVRHYFGDDVIEQSGELDGVVSYLAYYKKARLTVVHLSNIEIGPNDRVGKALGALALGHSVEPIEWPPADASGSPDVIGDYTGEPGAFRVTLNRGQLFARWKGAEIAQYLQPAPNGRFFVPADGSYLEFRQDDAHRTAVRRWGSFQATFELVKPT